MQAQGYRPKNKSLEEILKSSIKQEARLIGYNEPPTQFIATDTILIENLEKLRVSSAADDANADIKTINREPTINMSYQNLPASPIVTKKRNKSETYEDGSCDNGLSNRTGIVFKIVVV